MGGHNKKKKDLSDQQFDLYTGLPLDSEIDSNAEDVEKKSRHGKKKTELLKEQQDYERWHQSDQPVPGHEESNSNHTQNKGPKKKK